MRIAELYVYPLKGARAVPVQRSRVLASGLSGDREAVLVGPDGECLTQRELPMLATVEAQWDRERARLLLEAPGHGMVSATRPDEGEGEILDVRIWGGVGRAQLTNEVDRWLEAVLGRPVRLGFIAPKGRDVPGHLGTPIGFADAYPMLLCNRASLGALCDAMDDAAGVDMSRFRPNIVVEGAPAWAEDEWATLRVGDLELEMGTPCARCVVTTVDQRTGKKTGPEPLATLKKLRSRDNEVFFGTNVLLGEHGGTLQVGDEVHVAESTPTPPPF